MQKGIAMNYYLMGRKKLDENDFSLAESAFRDGMVAGDSRCAYGLVALAARKGEPLEDALKVLEDRLSEIRDMAENQDGEACFILGRCYETGSALSRSIPDAIVWYTRASGFGNADAMFNLGCIYMELDPDAKLLAVEQFRRAAECGCMEAKAALEFYYRQQS